MSRKNLNRIVPFLLLGVVLACKANVDVKATDSKPLPSEINPTDGKAVSDHDSAVAKDDEHQVPQPPEPIAALASFSAATGPALDGTIVLTWSYLTPNPVSRLDLRRGDDTAPDETCNSGTVVASLTNLTTPTTFVDQTGSSIGSSFGYRACPYAASGKLGTTLAAAGVPARDTKAPYNLDGFLTGNGPTDGVISVSVDLPNDTADYAELTVYRVPGSSAPSPSCSGTIVHKTSGPFADLAFFDDTGSTIGAPFTYQVCITDKQGNLNATTVVAGVRAPDSVPPPPPTAFTALANLVPGEVEVTLAYPAVVDDYASVVIRRGSGVVPASTCNDGDVSRQETGGFGGTLNYTEFTGGGFAFHYRACVYDSNGNLEASLTATTGYVAKCGAGEWLSGGACSAVGSGYFSGADDNLRYQCNAGNYCSSANNSLASGDGVCQAGYYCAAGSVSATAAPSGAGFYTNAGAALPSDCGPGVYCPNAANTAADRTACDAGSYCGTFNNSVSTGDGPCQAGYYCVAGSSSAMAAASGAGSYTAAGASAATNCGAGFYCPNAANTSTDRAQCTAGRYCSTANNTLGSGNGACQAGYICPAGSTSATEIASGAGYYTNTGASAAIDCGAGYYCPNTANTSADRVVCAAGYYCSTANNIAATGDGSCQAGYVCAAGSTSATAAASGAGYYTNAGASVAVDCGAGYYCPNSANSATDRSQCAAGRYCSSAHNTLASGDGACQAGYYCPAGSTSATASVAGYGYYAAAGASAPSACVTPVGPSVPANGSWTSNVSTSSTCAVTCDSGYAWDSATDACVVAYRYWRTRLISGGTTPCGATKRAVGEITFHWNNTWQVNGVTSKTTGTIGDRTITAIYEASFYDVTDEGWNAFGSSNSWVGNTGSFDSAPPYPEMTPQWITVDFGASPVWISGYRLYGTLCPIDGAYLQYSNDNSSWVTVPGSSFDGQPIDTLREFTW